jgi:hypothetical protein
VWIRACGTSSSSSAALLVTFVLLWAKPLANTLNAYNVPIDFVLDCFIVHHLFLFSGIHRGCVREASTTGLDEP